MRRHRFQNPKTPGRAFFHGDVQMDGDITKRNIVKALRSLMKTTPLEKITVTDISMKAKIARQTFYYHFDNVYEVFIWFIATNNPHPEKKVPAGYVPSPAMCTMGICQFFEKNKPFILAFRRVYHREFIDILESYFTDVFRTFLNHIYPDSVMTKDLDTLTMFLAIGYTGFVEKWFDSEMDIDIKGMFEELFGALDVGVPADILGKAVANIPPFLWQPRISREYIGKHLGPVGNASDHKII